MTYRVFLTYTTENPLKKIKMRIHCIYDMLKISILTKQNFMTIAVNPKTIFFYIDPDLSERDKNIVKNAELKFLERHQKIFNRSTFVLIPK